jgi:hypothetical protein
MPRTFRSQRLWAIVLLILTATLVMTGLGAGASDTVPPVWPVAGPV